MSTEEKKGTPTFDDTATTQFYTCQRISTSKKESELESLTISNVEDQLAKVRQTLHHSADLINRLQSNQELKRYVEETKQELLVIKVRTDNELNNTKLSFQKNFGSLERELAAYRKNWKAAKEKAVSIMEEQTSSFSADLKKYETFLSKKLATVTGDVKSKSSSLAQELKKIKKARGQTTSNLINLVQHARIKFDKKIEAQRKKRSEYEQIVLGLLDRTVQEGERILRRIC